MTDSEILSLYTEYTIVVVTYVGMLVSILFAYLAANYLAAKKFSWLQFSLLGSLFLVISIDLASNVWVHDQRLSTIESEILQRISSPDSAISYISTTGLGESNSLFVFAFWVIVSLTAVVFSIQMKRKKD